MPVTKQHKANAMSYLKQVNWPTLVISVLGMLVPATVSFFASTANTDKKFSVSIAVMESRMTNMEKKMDEKFTDMERNSRDKWNEISDKLDSFQSLMVKKTQNDELKGMLMMLGARDKRRAVNE